MPILASEALAVLEPLELWYDGGDLVKNEKVDVYTDNMTVSTFCIKVPAIGTMSNISSGRHWSLGFRS